MFLHPFAKPDVSARHSEEQNDYRHVDQVGHN